MRSPNFRRALIAGVTAALSACVPLTSAARNAPPASLLVNLPASFEPNRGQMNARFLFAGRGSDYRLFIEKNALVFVNERGAVHRIEILSARESVQAVGLDPLPGRSNYFIGNDPSQWHTDVPQFARVKLAGLYPGIDLILYGEGGTLEYDFVVSPHADPKHIRLRFKDADRVSIDADGNLVASLPGGSVMHRRPRARLERNGFARAVEGRFRRREKDVWFEIPSRDPRDTLVIDPAVTMSTFLGGASRDSVNDIAIDTAGNIYLTGTTESTNFPIQSPFQSQKRGEADVFIMKLNPTASAVLYSTFLGTPASDDADTGYGIAVDGNGNAYIAGSSKRCGFPTTPNAFQPACHPVFGVDAVVSKLSPQGNSLVYSTYLHGTSGGDEEAYDIAIDSAGNAYVVGRTDRKDFPVTAGSFQTTHHGGDSLFGPFDDAFVTVFNSSGSGLVYSTFLGGPGIDRINGVAVDAHGAAYVAGTTTSDFPVHNPFQFLFGGGTRDAFLAKLNPAGSALEFSTYFGGSEGDSASSLAIDSSGNVYLTGDTESTNLPLAHALQKVFAGGETDAFVAEFSASGAALIYATYLGGKESDGGNAIAIDPAGNAYVTGFTASTDFPLVAPVQPQYGGERSNFPVGDAFVTKIRAGGSAILYSTFLGGIENDQGNAIAVSASSTAFVAGSTESTNFPTVSAIQSSFKGGTDGFLTVLSDGAAAADLTLTVSGAPDPVAIQHELTYTITVRNSGPGSANGVTLSDQLATAFLFFVSMGASQGSCQVAGSGLITCGLGAISANGSATVTVVVRPTRLGTLANTASVASATPESNLSNNNASTTTTVTETPVAGRRRAVRK